MGLSQTTAYVMEISTCQILTTYRSMFFGDVYKENAHYSPSNSLGKEIPLGGGGTWRQDFLRDQDCNKQLKHHPTANNKETGVQINMERPDTATTNTRSEKVIYTNPHNSPLEHFVIPESRRNRRKRLPVTA